MKSGKIEDGGMAEWLKAAVLKTVNGVTRSGVRIPLPPPAHQKHPRWSTACALRPIPAVSLALEPANITAVANDVGTEVIFLRQLIAQGHPGDMAVGLSTSGGSRNIVMALEEARKRRLTTAARLGYAGGEVLRRGLADFPIVVCADYIPRIQEVQPSIYHIVREAMEANRYQLIGTTLGGRRLKIIFQLMSKNIVRIITGWPL